MPLHRSVPVPLNPDLYAVAERLLASGWHGNVTEVVRPVLRLLDERKRVFQGYRDGWAASDQAAGGD